MQRELVLLPEGKERTKERGGGMACNEQGCYVLGGEGQVGGGGVQLGGYIFPPDGQDG